MIDPMLIERIYEAAALPALWPAVLQDIADDVGAFGSALIARSPHVTTMIPSIRVGPVCEAFVTEGWAADVGYAAPLLAEQHPGFRAETAYRTVDEIERLPVHREFYAPRGLIAGVGTVIQGTRDDLLQVAIEGFPSHAAAEQAVPVLDVFRAPLARALSLTSRLGDAQTTRTVAALDLAGVAAAVVSGDGRLRAANELFTARLGDGVIDRPGGLRFADRFLQTQFADTLVALRAGAQVRSIAVAGAGDQPACVIHLLPLKRGARDVFGWDGILLLLAEAANASVPNADLLRLLFDLTPTEARLTRHLVEGRTPAEAAAMLRITEATARTHLRRIFAKTGVRRQAELVRLLLGLGEPK